MDATLTATDVQQTPGGGIRGRIGGQCLTVGSVAFMRSQGVGTDVHFESLACAAVASGATPIIISLDGQCVAVAGIADPVRKDVPSALAELQALGWRVRLLSGDHSGVVAAVARQLGIAAENAIGEVTPEDKTRWIRKAGETEPVVMVGDGVNDAVALAAATVGIAVHGGAEASLRAAHVYLGRPGLTQVVELILRRPADDASHLPRLHRLVVLQPGRGFPGRRRPDRPPDCGGSNAPQFIYRPGIGFQCTHVRIWFQVISRHRESDSNGTWRDPYAPSPNAVNHFQ